jgi:hypothetical protein
MIAGNTRMLPAILLLISLFFCWPFSMAMRVGSLPILHELILQLSGTVNTLGNRPQSTHAPPCAAPHAHQLPQITTTTPPPSPRPLVADMKAAKTRFHVVPVSCVGAWRQNDAAATLDRYFDASTSVPHSPGAPLRCVANPIQLEAQEVPQHPEGQHYKCGSSPSWCSGTLGWPQTNRGGVDASSPVFL